MINLSEKVNFAETATQKLAHLNQNNLHFDVSYIKSITSSVTGGGETLRYNSIDFVRSREQGVAAPCSSCHGPPDVDVGIVSAFLRA